MKEEYVYVRLTDRGINSSNLYRDEFEEPEKWLIELLKLKKQEESKIYVTNLLNVGKAHLDLVAVTPKQYEERGHYTRVENIYIFKGMVDTEKHEKDI